MARQRSTIAFTVAGPAITALAAGPAPGSGKPPIAALHGGAGLARAAGHSTDHRISGHALHLRQLAFAGECQLWARQQG